MKRTRVGSLGLGDGSIYVHIVLYDVCGNMCHIIMCIHIYTHIHTHMHINILMVDLGLHSIWPLVCQTKSATSKPRRRFVPKMKFPNHMTLREVELLRALHHTDEIAAAMEVEKTLMDTKMKEIKERAVKL